MIKIKNKTYIKAFGKHLRQLRLDKKLSQENLAYDADTSSNQIGRIERGEVNVTISTIYAISKALEIHPQELFDFKS